MQKRSVLKTKYLRNLKYLKIYGRALKTKSAKRDAFNNKRIEKSNDLKK